ncbi:MAG: hypothetical protein DLM52_12230 [Chthoniobacterales bacterium]|nr:MAG: hypothetical protein DLM52_12230 [Chthoniobacterales bacterium]
MKLITATLVAVSGFGLSAAPLAHAADDSFVGKWKLNPDKSQFSGLVYKVEEAGSNQYKFIFGDDVETITLGKDHLTKFGNTWLITKSGANGWKWTQKRNGKITSDATWTVSEDGATSTYVSTETRPDGSTSHDETKLKRTAGSAGLAGTWESTEIKVGSPVTIEMAKWQGDGYAIKNPTSQSETNFKLDGKDYTPKGPRVAKGTTVSAKAIDDHNIELAYKLKGKTTETDRWELSADGQTLTSTVNYPGESKPEVDVYDRQ